MLVPSVKYYFAQKEDSKSQKIKNVITFASNPNETFKNYVCQGNVKMVELLLDTGAADIEFIDRFGRTPVMAAIFNKDYDMVVLLTRKGANLAARSESGLSPLEISLLHGDIRTSQFLIAKGSEHTEVAAALEQWNFYLDGLKYRAMAS